MEATDVTVQFVLSDASLRSDLEGGGVYSRKGTFEDANYGSLE